MTTTRDVQAHPSVTGHYGIQYPNCDVDPVVVPEGSELSELSWVSPRNEYKAYAWMRDSGPLVVWIKS